MTPIPLNSIPNARDLGGTLARDKRRIRSHCLIRSAHLGRATTDDVQILQHRFRVRVILDLRTAEEIESLPDEAPGITVLPIPILGKLSGITHEKTHEPEPLPDMALLYRQMMTSDVGISGFRRALKLIMSFDYSAGSVLWHCTEGKDRCGMLTALVLEALGVDREVILEDYLATNAVNLPKAERIYGKLWPRYGKRYAQSIRDAYIADERYIRAAWDVMGRDYLKDSLGLEEKDLLLFREKLLM